MDQKAPEFTNLIDLASEKLGGKTLICSDDFFAPMENLLKQGRGIFIEDKYTDRGKWMDGWESRRKRTQGHDWCVIKLGASGIIKGFEIDTNHFLGNHPPHTSVDACNLKSEANIDDIEWKEVLTKSSLEPGSQHFFGVNTDNISSHIRLNIYPDGGIARFRVYGEVHKNWDLIKKDEVIDLASALNGGKAVLCNDMFFSHMDNLIMPGPGQDMGDGWETKRNRNPDNVDWVIIKLAKKGSINKIIVDTKHFKGNYPDRCSLLYCSLNDGQKIDSDQIEWKELLPQSKLKADTEHVFEKEIKEHQSISHVRLDIFPDGGVSRLRLFGKVIS